MATFSLAPAGIRTRAVVKDSLPSMATAIMAWLYVDTITVKQAMLGLRSVYVKFLYEGYTKKETNYLFNSVCEAFLQCSEAFNDTVEGTTHSLTMFYKN